MKQEKMWDNKMADVTDTASCASFGDLVAFLYGEPTDLEAGDFQIHLDACATCRADLSAFGQVRARIGAWRDEALHPMSMTATNTSTQLDTVKAVTNRSALAALREFFTLSPLWLRGVTAFASVLFVTLLIITALHYFERPVTRIVQQASPAGATKIENRPVATVEKNSPAEVAAVKKAPGGVVSSPSNRTKPGDNRVALHTKSNRRATAPVLSAKERSELSDLLIAAKEDEESVPRLDDLLSESN